LFSGNKERTLLYEQIERDRLRLQQKVQSLSFFRRLGKIYGRIEKTGADWIDQVAASMPSVASRIVSMSSRSPTIDFGTQLRRKIPIERLCHAPWRGDRTHRLNDSLTATLPVFPVFTSSHRRRKCHES
jgi:hypothetical protein